MTDLLELPGGASHEIVDGLVLGRAPDSGICLPDGSVSRAHARVSGRSGSWVLADLHSRNGTWVNATQLLSGGAHPLRHRDVVRLGRLVLGVVLAAPGAEHTTTSLDAAVLAQRLPLTPYQLSVLRCLCTTRDPEEPPSNAEIARALGTPDAVDAVKTAFSRIYARAGLTGATPGKRRELRRRAQQQGWLT